MNMHLRSIRQAVAASAWLFAVAASAQTPVTLATTDYPPYYGATLPRGGVLAEVATEAFKRSGYALKIEWLPWSRALASGEEGKVEGLLGVWHSAEREKAFVFSSPLANTEVGFFRRSDQAIDYRSLADLKPYVIGTVRGYANPKAFEEAKLKVDVAGNDTTNLRKLASARLDLVLIDRGVAQHLISTQLPDLQGKLQWLEPAVEKLPLYVVFSRRLPNHAKLLADFNAGLQSMEQDGSLNRMLSAASLGPAPKAAK